MIDKSNFIISSYKTYVIAGACLIPFILIGNWVNKICRRLKDIANVLRDIRDKIR